MLEDDDDEFRERASRAATDMARGALAIGKDVDWAIKFCRDNERDAVDRRDSGKVRWWSTVGTILHHRQQSTDVALCEAIEQIEHLDELWPPDYGQALDLNDEPQL